MEKQLQRFKPEGRGLNIMILVQKKNALSHLRRKKRIRKKIIGTQENPRLSVYRSNKNIYAQLIDDISSKTLTSVSTFSKEIRDEVKKMKKTEASKLVGALLAKKAVQLGIKRVIFDRNGFLYHGRIKALANGARENGLKF